MDTSVSKFPILMKVLEKMMWTVRTNQLQQTTVPPSAVLPSSPSSDHSPPGSALVPYNTCEKITDVNKDSKLKTMLQMLLQKSLHVLGQAGQQMMAHLLLVQGIMILLSVALSAMVFFPLGTITANFGGQCLLFSRIYLTAKDLTLRAPTSLDTSKTEFGSVNDCDYTTFLSVTVTVAGIIFLWFLIHLGRVSELEKSESGLLLSTFLFYFVLLICVIISSIKISSGFSYWCDNINICDQSNCQKLHCDKFSQLIWEDREEDTSKFFTYFEIAQISSWLLAMTLLIECVVTSQRIYQNFKLSLLEEETIVKKLDTTSESSVNGIINKGSDDYVDAATGGQLSDSSDSFHRILADVTVHSESQTLPPNGSYEMSDIAGTSAIQIVSEADSKPPKKKHSDLIEHVDTTDSDKPKSRRRKVTSMPHASKELKENEDVTDQVKTETTAQQKIDDQGKGNV